jgi:cation diffusion facilitator family transporter
MLRAVPRRRSRAAVRNAAHGNSVRVILIALGANLVVAVAKLIAGLLSGSVAMLAESAHSVADSLNEVLLGFSLRRGGVPADLLHPLGHGRERFLWAFLAAIASFLIGGCLSIGLAIWELTGGGATGDVRLAWVVLVVSFAADGTSLLQSLRQARQEAGSRRVSLPRYLLRASDPTLRAVVVEDLAALIGLGLAACGLALSTVMGSEVPDALASLLIGILLAFTAVGLAVPLAGFLVGRSLPPEHLQHLYEILTGAPAIEEVLTLQAVYTGPEEAIVAAKVHPIADLTVDQLAGAMDEIDVTIRSAFPEVADVFIDVTAYRLNTLPLGEGLTSVDGEHLADATALGPAAATSTSESGQQR